MQKRKVLFLILFMSFSNKYIFSSLHVDPAENQPNEFEPKPIGTFQKYKNIPGSSALPPKYLQEINVIKKTTNKKQTRKALSELPSGTIIAIRSLLNGAYLFVDKDGSLATTKKMGSWWRLGYTEYTPKKTQFKIERNRNLIILKSLSNNKILTSNKDNYQTSFSNTVFYKNKNQLWTIESADGLNQIYLKNKLTGGYLSITGEHRNKIVTGEEYRPIKNKTKSELFKITIIE